MFVILLPLQKTEVLCQLSARQETGLSNRCFLLWPLYRDLYMKKGAYSGGQLCFLYSLTLSCRVNSPEAECLKGRAVIPAAGSQTDNKNPILHSGLD